jgi:hypothetical protein
VGCGLCTVFPFPFLGLMPVWAMSDFYEDRGTLVLGESVSFVKIGHASDARY